MLTGYQWPGNVRQLRNIMARLALHLAASPLQALTPTLLHLAAPELLRPAGTTNQFGPAWPNPAMAALATSGALAARELATPAPAPDTLEIDPLSAESLEQLLARFGQQKKPGGRTPWHQPHHAVAALAPVAGQGMNRDYRVAGSRRTGDRASFANQRPKPKCTATLFWQYECTARSNDHTQQPCRAQRLCYQPPQPTALFSTTRRGGAQYDAA